MKEEMEDIELSRRGFIKTTAIGAVFIMAGAIPVFVKTAQAEVDEAEKVKGVLKRFFGDSHIDTGHIDIKAPIIAENGTVVPVTVISDLPMSSDDYVKKIYIFAESNMNPFVASAQLSPANGKAEVALRIKMAKTSNVRAVAETSKGKLYQGIKTVKVTVGGCGGL